MKYFLFIFLLTNISMANENEDIPEATNISPDAIQRINTSYQQKVKPLFKRTCFDCHSDQTVYPWYYKIPGFKQIIDHDIEEGRAGLEMSKDYPFKGSKKGLKHDLKEIWEEIEEGEMPPLMYRIFSTERTLTSDEKIIIKKWVEESLKEFK